MPTDIHLPPKIDVLHLHIFEEGVFCRKTIKDDQNSLQKVIRNSLVLMRPSYRINLGLNEKVHYAVFEAGFNVFPERIHLPQACEGISPTIEGRWIAVWRSQKALLVIFPLIESVL